VTALDYFLNGRELVFRRRFAEAIRPLRRAIQLDPDQTSAHLLLAVAHLYDPETNRLHETNRLSEAAASLTACIKSHQEMVGLYLLRAQVAVEQANQALARAGQGRPIDSASSRLRQEAADAVETAETDFRRALDLKPGDDLRYALLANRGLLRLHAGRLDEAVADLDAAIRLKPGQYQAHNTLAQVFLREGRPADASAAFTRAIACHPDPNVLAGLYRGRALIFAAGNDLTPGRRQSALGDLDESIRHEPEKTLRASDHVWRARLLLGDERLPEALAACDAALELVPEDPEAHRVRISALMELRRHDEVLAACDAYLARGRPSAEVFEIRGLARRARRENTAAVGDFNRAIELSSAAELATRSRLFRQRGWAHYYADAPRLALADFEEALRLEPDRGDAYGGRGLARIRLGDWRPAVSDAEAGLRHVRESGAGSTPEEGQSLRVQALYNAARIYAQAVEFAAGEVSHEGERAVTLYRRYRARARDLLEEALERVHEPERREEILGDPALRLLRRRPGPGSAPSPRPRQASLSRGHGDDR
jgi:tetratricopeptide (TPR) repeat protein